MKAILVFDLPDEETEYKMAIYGGDYLLILSRIQEQLRQFIKYGHKFNSADDALEYMQKFIYDEIQFRDVPTDP